jgi:hypothetical protein
VNIGKYLTALTASNSDLDLQPADPHALQTTRTWNDRLSEAIHARQLRARLRSAEHEANGECGRMDNQNFGKEIFTKSFDPSSSRLGQAHVQLGDGRLGAAGAAAARRRHRGYFRRWFGNFYTANNRLTTAADYTPFSIPIPRIRGCRAAAAAR